MIYFLRQKTWNSFKDVEVQTKSNVIFFLIQTYKATKQNADEHEAVKRVFFLK